MASSRIRVLERGESGSFPPVLLLHGFTGSAEAWGEEVVGTLSETRTLLAADLPGHGSSRAPSDPEGYALERVACDLLEILDRMKLARADWVGYSMGGRVALGAAVLHPRRVRRLVLEGASPGLATAEERRRRRREDDEIARRIESEGIEAFVEFWMGRPIFASQARLPEAVLRDARESRLRHRPEALAAVLRGLGTGSQPSFWRRLDEVEAPTLLLTGELDGKFEALARAMVERIPRAFHRSIPDAGHTTHLERPEAWLDAVLAFLNRDEPES